MYIHIHVYSEKTGTPRCLPLFCWDFTFNNLFVGHYGLACADSFCDAGDGNGLSEDDFVERSSGCEADFKGWGGIGRGVVPSGRDTKSHGKSSCLMFSR